MRVFPHFLVISPKHSSSSFFPLFPFFLVLPIPLSFSFFLCKFSIFMVFLFILMLLHKASSVYTDGWLWYSVRNSLNTHPTISESPHVKLLHNVRAVFHPQAFGLKVKDVSSVKFGKRF